MDSPSGGLGRGPGCRGGCELIGVGFVDRPRFKLGFDGLDLWMEIEERDELRLQIASTKTLAGVNQVKR